MGSTVGSLQIVYNWRGLAERQCARYLHGVIDAETDVRPSDAVMASASTDRACFPLLDTRAWERIRARAGDVLRQRWAEGVAD